MNSGAGLNFRWVFYCCYAVVLTAVLLYVRFPGVKFKQYCERQAERLFIGTTCSVGSVAYSFPLGLSLGDMIFSQPNQKSTPLVKLNNLKIFPALDEFGRTFKLSGESYSGQISGTLHLERTNDRFSLEAIRLQDISLGEMKLLHDVLGRELSGLIYFTGSYFGVINQYLAGKVQGKMKLKDGKIALVQPVLGLSAIDLQELEVEINGEKSELQLSKGRMKGKELSVDFSSKVQLISPWYISGITATGDVAPQAEFIKGNKLIQNEVRALQKQYKKATIPFRITGSLQKPAFRFGL